MARMWGLSEAIIRLTRTDEELEFFGAPEEFDDTLEFDVETNEEMLSALDSDWNAHTLSGGILRRNGIPITINPPGQHFLDRATVKEFWDDLGNGIDWLEAHRQTWQSSSDAWGGLTNAQKQTQLLDNFGVLLGDFSALLYINYRVLIFIRWLIKALKLLVGL